MTTPISSTLAALKDISDKLDNLITALPNTYVTIRHHDLQIKAHEEKLNDYHDRISQLELWRREGTQWANNEHNAMRDEWTNTTEKLNDNVNSLDKTVSGLSNELKTLIGIAKWLLGIFTAIGVGVFVGIILHII